MDTYGFPLFVRLTHWFNFLFLALLARSGLGILAAHPKLYWRINCRPGSEWLKLSRGELPKDRMWCSTDEERPWSSWLALPGGHGLGLARYWHFLIATLWTACGLFYAILAFASPQWKRLVPTSWEVFPCAVRCAAEYVTLNLSTPRAIPPYTYDPALPYNALQQLTYFGVIYFLSPVMILTGIWQAPAILGRFPWMERILNRQAARSLHFLGLILFVGFLAIHLTMIVAHGTAESLGKMVLGEEHTDRGALALGIGFGIIAGVVLLCWLANLVSEHQPRATQRVLASLLTPIRSTLFRDIVSRQDYTEEDISPHFRINGYPPISAYPQAQGEDSTYERLLANRFNDYRLEVFGLVEQPLSLSLDDLRAMPQQEQVTLHHCIQGWTSIGRWGGVRIAEVLDRCQPLPEAKYLVIRSFGMHEKSDKVYYECVDLEIARNPQAILALRLNGEPLPVQHGAPVRCRFENQLGFKMVKYVRSIELVDDYRKIGEGMGGVREDKQQYAMGAEI